MKNDFLLRNYFVGLMIITLTLSNYKMQGQYLENNMLKIKEQYDLVGGTVLSFNKTGITNLVNFGKINLENNLPVTNNTKFRIASISKTITAIAFMQLVEQNKISLDVNISKVLGYDCSNPYFSDVFITPRMLLSHTSSLNDDTDSYDAFLSSTYEKNPVPDLSMLINDKGGNYSKHLFLNKKPGSYFNYCNLNYGILGTLIEKITSIRFDQYCEKFIFNPMGINASFNVNDIGNTNELATLYRKMDNEWKSQCDDYSQKGPDIANITEYKPGSNAIRFGPQGGLRISGTDLAKIFMLFLNDGKFSNKQIISKKSINEMISSQWRYDGQNGDDSKGLFRNWGLGLHLITNTKDNDQIFTGDVNMFGHSGDAYGLISDAFVETKKGNGFVFITNGSGFPLVDSDCTSFYTIEKDVFDMMGAIIQKPKIQIKSHK